MARLLATIDRSSLPTTYRHDIADRHYLQPTHFSELV